MHIACISKHKRTKPQSLDYLLSFLFLMSLICHLSSDKENTRGKRSMAFFSVLENIPQMPCASMQMEDYSSVEESKCWLLKSYLIFFSLLLHWKEKYLTKQQITEKFKYHDKKRYVLFPWEQNKTVNFQNPTSHTTAVVAKPILTTHLL